MKTLPSPLRHTNLLALMAGLFVSLVQQASAFPVITNVVETGGDNKATDTVTAKWTGVRFVGGIVNEPVPSLTCSRGVVAF